MLYLESPRLLIRNLKDEDLDDFISYRSIPEVAKYQGYEVLNKKSGFEFILSQKAAQLDLPGKWIQLAIVEKASEKLVGDCALRLMEEDVNAAQVGCTISPLYQRKGFASETLKILINYLLSEASIKKIITVIEAENMASVNLMSSLHFEKTGEEIVKFKGQWCKEFKYTFQIK
jgi:ribosomal-protein-alanine N-acetyltransferase